MSELTSFWVPCILDGIATGFVYGLFGLCLVVIFRANKLFNFAQTQVVALLVIALTMLIKRGLPLHWALVGGIAVAFFVGLVLHFGVMRIITERKRAIQSGEVLATFGLATLFDGISGFLFSDAPEPFPSVFGNGSRELLGLGVSNNTVGIIAVTALLTLALILFFRFSRAGLLMEAVSENMIAARLRAIRASDILAMAWGLTTMLAMIGGVMLAPVLFVFPQMLAPTFGYSLMAVVIGGFESFAGALIGGIMIGVVENLSANVESIGAELKFAPVFAMLLIVLYIQPRGLFGKTDIRRI